MSDIPPSLAPFFQEYDVSKLDLERSAGTIIERTLQYGNREEIFWLFHTYQQQRIRDWVAQWGNIALPEPHRTFWALILDLPFDLDFFSPTEDIPAIRVLLEKSLQPFSPILADSSWGNLVFLARKVRMGFYGYGYPMVGEFVQAEGARLASIADIGLMKLDALLARASRKDFIDLYFICQHIPLRKLLDLAPQKYPSIRDFESQSVRRLVYFDRAEQEEETPLLQPVITWDEVKQYFRDQAKTLGRGWFDP